MMIEPAIDELVAKAGNKYIACNLVAKRANNIQSVRGAELANKDKKAITIACEEIVAGKVVPSDTDDNSGMTTF